VTLLATDGVGGLQVRRRDGGWIDVPALPGAFVCNIGDCLMRWSNDVYVSTPHRVLPPTRERYSIAFFLDPNPNAMVSAIPSCIAPGESPRHAPISAGDYLRQRFEATYTRA
jgi:isopenicillin N synthase-like dioxygenase